MKNKKALILLLILALSSFQVAMARKGIYDEEARENERLEKSEAKQEGQSQTKSFAGRVKKAAEVEEPQSKEDTTKIKFKIPGT